MVDAQRLAEVRAIILAAGAIDLDERQIAVAIVILGYVAVQVILAISFAAAGFRPRGYQWVQLKDLTPETAEAASRYRARLLSEHRNNLAQNMWVTNRRYDDMILARFSLRNAAIGVGLFVIVLVLAVLAKHVEITLR